MNAESPEEGRSLRIAVAGGTGRVGAHTVELARARGHDVVVLARRHGVDLRTGSGVTGALSGADAIIDVVSIDTLDAKKSVEFFEATTKALLDAAAAESVPHHLALSIVGIDRAPEGYYAGKLAQERLIQNGPVPWTLLRATQFHEFAAQIYASARVGPLHVAPKMRTQPVAALEVAERLVALAEAGPGGRVRDLAGPREESLVDMVRQYARARGSRGWIPAIALPGALGRAQRGGALLPGADADLGRQGFAEWLAEL